jgi:hypothetical protein
MVATPIGRMLRVCSDRAPSALHVLSLVRTETEAVLALAMRMHWPPDGSSADLEASGAGPQHLPYDRLSVMDEQGTRYAIRFESGGPGGGNRVARYRPLGAGAFVHGPAARPGRQRYQARRAAFHLWSGGCPGRPGDDREDRISPGERLLVLEAERILATREPRAPRERPDPAEISAVLKETGVIAQDSPLPSQLAALYRRLGGDWPTRTGPPASSAATAEIPAPWASVLAGYSTPRSAEVPEVFAPVAQLLPEIDGTRFALAGLSITAGESHLHVIGSGHLPTPADRYEHNWTPGFSWWLEDNAGNWHVATLTEPWSFGDGLQSFLLRLTSALDSVPGRVEVVVTGPATQIRAVVPIG